ncbi:MAG: hypothetical protein LJE91_17520 [Gammaproteobacteria bacterium]|nr:hypothetical protein [Gammaproteobacteria bacterium]
MMGITDPMSFWGAGAGFTPPANTPWPGAFSGMPGTTGPYGGPRYGGRGVTLRALQGTWAGANGTLLMVDGKRFMLYLDEQLAGIGTLRIVRQSLFVQDAVSRQSRTYGLALRDNLMIWTERGGRTQAFRRIAR